MEKKSLRLKRTQGIFRICMTLLISFSFLSATAFAAGPSTGVTGLDSAFDAVFVSGRSIGLAIAGVALAAEGFAFFGGNEKVMERAKMLVKITLLALVAYLLLPAIVSFAYSIVQSFSWDPNPAQNPVIVQGAP